MLAKTESAPVAAVNAVARGGSSDDSPYYRIAEMQFTDVATYERYLAWFKEHPIPAERGPKARTVFRFYVLTESVEATR